MPKTRKYMSEPMEISVVNYLINDGILFVWKVSTFYIN